MQLTEPKHLVIDSTGNKVNIKRDYILHDVKNKLSYRQYSGEEDLQAIIGLIAKDLSEPYSIYTYRYFVYNWPDLCVLAVDEDERIVGCIVNKLDNEEVLSGYIAMLAVADNYRRRGIGSCLVTLAIGLMKEAQCDEIVLETEVTNLAALSLYEQMGFCRYHRLIRYYLNGEDAFRLKLFLTPLGYSNDLNFHIE